MSNRVVRWCFLPLLLGASHVALAFDCVEARTRFEEAYAAAADRADYSDSIRYFQQCIDRGGQAQLKDRYLLGYALYLSGRLDESLEMFNQLASRLAASDPRPENRHLYGKVLYYRARILRDQSLSELPAFLTTDLEQARVLFIQSNDLLYALEAQLLQADIVRLGADRDGAALEAARLLEPIVTGEAVGLGFSTGMEPWAYGPVVKALDALQTVSSQLRETPAVCAPVAGEERTPLACIQRALALARGSGEPVLQDFAEGNYYYQILQLGSPSTEDYLAAVGYWHHELTAAARSGGGAENNRYLRAAVVLSRCALFAAGPQFALLSGKLGIRTRPEAAELARQWLSGSTTDDPSLELTRKTLLAAALLRQASGAAGSDERSDKLAAAWSLLESPPVVDPRLSQDNVSSAPHRYDTVDLVTIEHLRGQYFELQSLVLPELQQQYLNWALGAYRNVGAWFESARAPYLTARGWLQPLQEHAQRESSLLVRAIRLHGRISPQDISLYP